MSHGVIADQKGAPGEPKPRGLYAKADDAVNRFILRNAFDWKLFKARRDPSYGVPLRGKRVLITGASSGIGAAAAHRFGALGAHVILVARRREDLEAAAGKIRAGGGLADFFVCDLNDLDAVDRLAEEVVARFGGVDVLINNAGHSIRRRTSEQLERWHDIERTMRINYFYAMRLTRDFLPGMLERRDGHIINVSSWVVPLEAATMFIGYGASKAAVSIATRTIELEYARDGVHGTSVHFPLVRTPMIAPTAEFDDLAALTPEEAAEWLVLAAQTRTPQVIPRVDFLVRFFDLLSPGLADRLKRFGSQDR